MKKLPGVKVLAGLAIFLDGLGWGRSFGNGGPVKLPAGMPEAR
jgi:hypothetical protein